jgi:hypothetical protein
MKCVPSGRFSRVPVGYNRSYELCNVCGQWFEVGKDIPECKNGEKI